MGSVTASIVALLLIVTWPGASFCAPAGDPVLQPPRVVLLRTVGDDVFAARLRAELAVWDWDVQEIGEPSAAGDEPLASVAMGNRARAAVRFQRRPAEAEIWTDSLPSGATIRLGVNNLGAKIESVLAVVAAEQLRSRLTAAGTPPPDPATSSRGTQKLAVAAPPVSEDRQRGAWVAATSGASVGAGGLGAAPHLIASAGAFLARGWSVNVLAAFPLAANQLTVPEGTTRVSPFVFGAGLERAALGPLWNLDLAGGLGMAWLILRGQSNDVGMFEGRRADLLLPLAWARLTVSRQLTPRWRARADALLAATAQPAIVQVAEHHAARWGQPALMISVGVELAGLREVAP